MSRTAPQTRLTLGLVKHGGHPVIRTIELDLRVSCLEDGRSSSIHHILDDVAYWSAEANKFRTQETMN